jgi:MFS family permease
MTVLTLAFLPETYAPTLLEAKAKHLRKSTGNPKFKSKLASTLPAKEVFVTALVRPLKMLFLSPIILAVSTFTAVSYAYLYLLFTTFPTVFQSHYGFSTGTVGLSYLGLGVGCLLGLLVYGILSDRVQTSRTAKYGVSKPEYRLVPMVYGAICIPVGLFWYGWSAEEHAHWIVPILGTCVVGIGLIATFMPAMTYLVDAFTLYAASALAANTVLRSVLGAVLPLAGERMYQTLGLGWGNSLLAFIAVGLAPIPIVFERYGDRLRAKFDVKF